MNNAFVDTNILVYAADSKGEDVRKKQIAREIILLPHLHLSVQVLNEFISVARNPKKLNLSRDEESKWLREWFDLKIGAITLTTFHKALELHLRLQLSHWDALIVASALESSCEIIYTEDLQHGQNIEGLQVINPFL
jgi:predicted nucleic acid-binding protein